MLFNGKEPKLSDIPKETLALCKGFPHNNLFITGATGTGKTHLAIAIANHFHKIQVSIYKPMQLYRKIRSCETAIEEEETIKSLVKQKILIIDDLGIEKRTEFSISVIYEIIDGRYWENPKGLIITSNLPLSDIAKLYDDRLASRLAGICKIVKLTGKDRRIKEA